MKNWMGNWHSVNAFDSYVKKVLKFAARDYFKHAKQRYEREVFFSELSGEDLLKLAVYDQYFPDVEFFNVCGWKVMVSDMELAEAIKLLTKRRREVILMCYFLDMTDSDIADVLNLTKSTVAEHRTSALLVLREILEARTDE